MQRLSLVLTLLCACQPTEGDDSQPPDPPQDSGSADSDPLDTGPGDSDPPDTGPQDTGTQDPCLNCVATFAIYDAKLEEDGVWEDEVTALQAVFAAYGWTWEIVGPQALNQGVLGSGEGQRYRALIAPGGSAYYRDQAITEEGEDKIRAFLEGGGGYVGFCAGTSWTADSIIWAEHATGGGGSYNAASDYATYEYDLKVFDGAIQAPVGWQPWDDGRNISVELAAIDTDNPTLAAAGLPAQTRIFYYGGPVYQPYAKLPGYEVWARAVMPAGLPVEAATGADEPTIIRFSYGEGTVILFSYHPVILVGSDVDGVELIGWADENATEWETGEQSWEEINLQSWNILHAALQVVAGEEVTEVVGLP